MPEDTSLRYLTVEEEITEIFTAPGKKKQKNFVYQEVGTERSLVVSSVIRLLMSLIETKVFLEQISLKHFDNSLPDRS